ncbi:MAG: tRNA (adenosine(37)-N6)-threonylcarbamoyltransferase complex ATPase subunit type 1 TsaE [Nitrospirota bacterium]
MSVEIITESPSETFNIGVDISRLLNDGDLICLFGELGAGKTCFIKGIGSGLGVDSRRITSPTFIIINEHRGRLRFYHIDLYRINNSSELEGIGFRDYIDGDGVTAVEWAEKAGKELPEERIDIEIFNIGGDRRRLVISAKGEHYEDIVKQIRIKD